MGRGWGEVPGKLPNKIEDFQELFKNKVSKANVDSNETNRKQKEESLGIHPSRWKSLDCYLQIELLQ